MSPWAVFLAMCSTMAGTLILIGEVTVKPLLAELEIARNTCPVEHVCYDTRGPLIQPQHVFSGTIVKVTYVDAALIPPNSDLPVRYLPDYDNNLSWCEITTALPEHVSGDPLTHALGHGLLHCLIGDFHP